MENIISPHDRFFRSRMTDLRVAKDFFSHYLPKQIQNKIALNSLKICPESYIDEQLKLQVADILYSVNIQQQQGFLYILVEHQSTPDKLMPFRVLRYTCAIMNSHLKKSRQKKLPLVIPLVFYHGEKPYCYSTNIFDLFMENKKLAEEFFLKPFKLIDVGQISDEEIVKHNWSGLMELVMKHIYNRDVLLKLEKFIPQFKILVKKDDLDYIKSLFTYLIVKGNIPNYPVFVDAIKKLLPQDIGEEIMTLREIFIEEGKKTGLQQSRQEIARSMFLKGYSSPEIMEITGLSIQEIIKLKNSEKNTIES